MIAAQLLVAQARDYYLAKTTGTSGDIDPAKNVRDLAVEQGAGDAFLVFGDHPVIAGRLAPRLPQGPRQRDGVGPTPSRGGRPAGSRPERDTRPLGIAVIITGAGMYTIGQFFHLLSKQAERLLMFNQITNIR